MMLMFAVAAGVSMANNDTDKWLPVAVYSFFAGVFGAINEYRARKVAGEVGK